VKLTAASTLPEVAVAAGARHAERGIRAVVTGGACVAIHTGTCVSKDAGFVLQTDAGPPTKSSLPPRGICA